MTDEELASNRRLYTVASANRNSLPETENHFPVKYLIRNAPPPLAAPPTAGKLCQGKHGPGDQNLPSSPLRPARRFSASAFATLPALG